MKVALNRPGKFSRSKQSRSNVPLKYASARRFFARLASEIFLTSLQTAFFNNLLVIFYLVFFRLSSPGLRPLNGSLVTSVTSGR